MRSLPDQARLAADALESKAWTAGVPQLLRDLAALADRQQLAADVAKANSDRLAELVGEQAEALRLRGLEVERLAALVREAPQ